MTGPELVLDVEGLDYNSNPDDARLLGKRVDAWLIEVAAEQRRDNEAAS